MSEMNKERLLGLINILHFGWLNEVNACVKHILACFQGGTLCLDTPVAITVGLISDITGLSKNGPDPSQYSRGKDNDKWHAAWLNK